MAYSSSFLAGRMSRGRRAKRSGAALTGTLGNWRNHTVSSGQAERQIERVSERALDLYTNDAMGHGVMESLLVESIGTGQTPQPSPMAEWIGMDETWAEQFQADALRCYAYWGLDFRNWCDAGRRMNILMLEGLAYFYWKLMGIGVFQVVTRKDPFRPFSLALLPIDPFRLVTPMDRTDAEIYDGVEIDNDGAPVAVWIQKPGSRFTRPSSSECTRVPVNDPKTGLPKMLLVCDVRSIAEYRQNSILGPMISEIRTSNDLTEAVLMSAAVRNLFTMFVNDFGQGGVTKDTPWDERILETERGTILAGSGKEKPTFFSHTAAPTGYRELWDSIIDRMGMATGRGPENVSRKFQASYSASRASMEKADQFNDREHMVMNNRFNQPWWAWLMYEAALRGEVPVKSIDHFLQHLHAYTNVSFLPQPFRHIDREKTAKANRIDFRDGRLTLAEIYGQKGQPWRQGVAEWAKGVQYVKHLGDGMGIDLLGIMLSDNQPATPENDTEQDGGDHESTQGD